MRRIFAFALSAASLPFLAGCLVAPLYVYPTIDVLPSQTLNAPEDEVKLFVVILSRTRT
jgi:hypothetical protein